MASMVAPRTMICISASAGTVLTISPHLVMMVLTRILSSSRKVSRRAWMPLRASWAMFRALIPSEGAKPAWAARPMKRTLLPMKPSQSVSRQQTMSLLWVLMRWAWSTMSTSSMPPR